ncbi:diacylglycerol kinase family protein [bacterium]|nr:diacylglycerol kinase family protein [bacterium]
MTKYKQNSFSNTFRNARKGMRLTIKSERNIRIHLFVAALVIISAYCLNFSINKFCIVLLTIAAVISAEMFNSAIEFALDATFHNKYSRMVGMAKDIAAGAVMVVSICAVMIGVLLFAPPIIALIVQ